MTDARSSLDGTGPDGPGSDHAAGWLEGLFDPHVLLEPVRDAASERVVDLVCTAANRPACVDLMGGPTTLIGARVRDLVDGEAGPGLIERLLEVHRTGTPLALDDVELSIGPGTPRRRFDLRAMRAGDGLVVSWRDVTVTWQERQALRDARAALADSEHRYRLIAELSSDFVYEIGPDMRIRWASPSIEALMGWTPDEIVGRTPMDLFPPEGHEESRGLVARSLTGEVIAGRRRLRRRDGSDRWFFRTARPVFAPDGSVESVVAGFRDIQSEVEADEARAASEERFRLIATNASDIVYLADPAGVVQWVSPSVNQIMGWPPDDLVGRRTIEFVHPDDRPMLVASAGIVNEGQALPIEFRLARKDGTYRWFAGTSRPLMDATGAVVARTGSMHDVTERHEAVEALARSEHRFRHTVDELLDPLVILRPIRDGSGRIVDFSYEYANPAACRFYRLTLDELVDHRIGELFPAIVAEGWIEVYGRIVETGEPYRADGMMAPGEDGDRYTDKRAYRMGGSMVLTWRDVTTQRRAQAALREAETRYRLLLHSAADMVVLADADATLTWVSPSVRTILGWEPEELIGQRLVDLVHPEEQTAWRTRRTEIDTMGGASYEARYRQADGTYRWMSVATTVVRDETGAVVARTGIFRDIAAEHAARVALEASRHELAEAQRVAHVGSWSWDLETDDVRWSDELFRISGYDPAGPMPDRAAQLALYTPETVAAFGSEARAAAMEGRSFQVAGDVVRASDGQLRHVIIRGEPVRASDGRIVRMRGTTADVTEQRAAELRIRELNEGLELRVRERTEELETFTYTLSHDLRAPLRWINGFAAMLQRRDGDRLDETSRHYLEEIRNASDRMGRLFEELLDYSRLGRQTVRTERIDWAGLIAGLRGTFAPRIAASGARLVIGETLAPVRGDPMLLDRALANLVDNALTYTKVGAPALVTIHAVERGGRVRVSVSDEGIGIPPDQRDRIFQPFVRLHDAETYPGTGIGLAIVQRAVALMGSTVHVDSVAGAGTTFWFELPAG